MRLKTVIAQFAIISVLLSATPFAVMAAPDDSVCPDTSGFIIIGEAEHVTFVAEKIRMKARIDTGAETSSLGVINQKPFERDGKKWISFAVQDRDNGKLTEFEEPVVRIASIKRHGAEDQKRPVVKLKIVLGKVEMKRQFTLADRSKYTFPVLIGRNVLSGKYLVDVNRKYSSDNGGGKEE